jgi:hypothetical protein
MSNLEQLRRSEILDIFKVSADRETGEWLGQPEPTGQKTTAWDWAQMQDTDATHYDTYTHDAETQAERALIVEWTD